MAAKKSESTPEKPPQLRPMPTDLRVLDELQVRQAEVTQQLRAETATADSVHSKIRRDLEELVDGIIEINAKRRD